jgi:hypothetical protein
VPAIYGNRVTYFGGGPVAVRSAGEVHIFEKRHLGKAREMKDFMLRTPAPTKPAALM